MCNQIASAISAYSSYRQQHTHASSTQQWLDYYGVQQQQNAAYAQQQQQSAAAANQPAMSLQNIEQVARAIYAAVRRIFILIKF